MGRKKRCKVFVSYSRHDEDLVKPLAGLLGLAADDAVFLDITSLNPGDGWEDEIIAAIRAAPVFVICWCCECQKSQFIAKEINSAISAGRKRLVPVLFCSTPLPGALASKQWIDLRNRVVHSCSEHSRDADIGPIQPLSAPSRLTASRSGARRGVFVGLSAIVCLLFVLFWTYGKFHRAPPVVAMRARPEPSVGDFRYACKILNGADAGNIYKLPQNGPARIGTPCRVQTVSGGELLGVIVREPPAGTDTGKVVVGVGDGGGGVGWTATGTMIIVLLAGLFSAGWFFFRRRFTDADTIAEQATLYFSRLSNLGKGQ